jgi:hypothetical protein
VDGGHRLSSSEGVSESILSEPTELLIRELLVEILDFFGCVEISEVDIATLYSTRVVKGQLRSEFSLPIFVVAQR